MKTTKKKENVPGCFGSTQTSHGANDLTIVLAKCFAFKIVVKHQCCHFLFLRARTDTFMDKTPSRPNVFVRVPRKKKKDKPKKEPQKKNHKLSPHPHQQESHPQKHAMAPKITRATHPCGSSCSPHIISGGLVALPQIRVGFFPVLSST